MHKVSFGEMCDAALHTLPPAVGHVFKCADREAHAFGYDTVHNIELRKKNPIHLCCSSEWDVCMICTELLSALIHDHFLLLSKREMHYQFLGIKYLKSGMKYDH